MTKLFRISLISLLVFLPILNSCKKDNDIKAIYSAPVAFPGISGELVDYIYNGDTITCEKINGFNIYQGDIILTEQQLNPFGDAKGTGILPKVTQIWESGIVYYEIDPTIPSKGLIDEAISEFERNTQIKFVPHTNQINYVEFILSKTGRASNIGMTGGKQEIWLNNITAKGDIIHETGHTLGLGHEHTRWDRNEYIIVHIDNIPATERHNFRQSDFLYNSDFFDFNSVMLYPSRNGYEIDPSKPSITKLDGQEYDVTYNSLSSSDIEMINKIYFKNTPEALFTVSTRFPQPNVNIQFTDYSANNPTSWLWDFGDGVTSTEQNPSHTYLNSGEYSVSLSVTNNKGSDIELKKGYILVNLHLMYGSLAYYPFNGNTNDLGGNDKTGIPTNVTYTSDRSGKSNSAAYFNGDGYVMVPCIGQKNGFSIALWYKTVHNGTILSTDNIFMGVTDTEPQDMFIAQWTIMGALGVGSLGPYGLPGYLDNTWHHVVITYNNPQGRNILYFDGVIKYDFPVSDPFLGNNESIYIGAVIKQYTVQFPYIQPFFVGSIDDVYFFGRALNQSEVKKLYNSPN
jgi:PKD repeat protein